MIISILESLYGYQSKGWDMDISLSELVKNTMICKVDRNYKRHKTDECYDGYCMYLKHPKSNSYSIMIGINNDGFMYIGDGENNELVFEDIDRILQEMFFYGEYMKCKLDNINKIKERL